MWAVSVGMEQVFTRQMLQSMRQTVAQNSSEPLSNEARVYQGMLDDEYANLTGEQGQLGIADMVYNYLDSVR